VSAPLTYQWDGDAMRPLAYFAKQADRQFVVGQRYRLEEAHQRSVETHNHYFAALHEAWSNLPEPWAERFPTPDHLRKYALIKAGFRTETTYVAHSKAEALRFASFLRSIDEYALAHVDDKLVTFWTAKSQSRTAMSAKEFQASKVAVLDVAANMIGVSADELTAHAGKAA
jgi:hypothetical protein